MRTIGVSGINATDNPGPGVGVARSLRESGEAYRIVGLSYDCYDPGHYLPDLFDRTYTLPYPAEGWAGIRARLDAIRAECGLDLVIPCLDAELPLYLGARDELAALGVRLFLPEAGSFALRDKERLPAFAPRIGMSCPRTVAVRDARELSAALREVGYPAMVKGPYYKAKRVGCEGEGFEAFAKLAAEWGLPVLVQETVAGEELNLVGLADGGGRLLGEVSAKKTTVTELGKIWSGVTIRHDGLKACAEAFARETRWRGPFELECIAGADSLHLIEINPRFPAWSWFSTAVGVNLAHALVRSAFEERVDPFPDYAPGKFFMRHTQELVLDLDRFRLLATKGASHA